jgi:hypothetical protein
LSAKFAGIWTHYPSSATLDMKILLSLLDHPYKQLVSQEFPIYHMLSHFPLNCCFLSQAFQRRLLYPPPVLSHY